MEDVVERARLCEVENGHLEDVVSQNLVSINPQDFCFILKQKGIKNIMDKKNINHSAPANHSVLYKTLKNFTNAVPCHCYRDCICKICN